MLWNTPADKVTLNKNLIAFLIAFYWQKLHASTLSTFWKKYFYLHGKNAMKENKLTFLLFTI